MRRMLVSRSSLLKPKPLLRFVRTSSPSRTSTRLPIALSRGVSASVSVDFPAPDMPVNQRVNPLSILLQLLTEKWGWIVHSHKSVNNPGVLFNGEVGRTPGCPQPGVQAPPSGRNARLSALPSSAASCNNVPPTVGACELSLPERPRPPWAPLPPAYASGPAARGDERVRSTSETQCQCSRSPSTASS